MYTFDLSKNKMLHYFADETLMFMTDEAKTMLQKAYFSYVEIPTDYLEQHGICIK